MTTLLLVDIRLESYEKIVEAARSNVSVVRFDSMEDTYASLLEKIQSSGLTSINIIGIAQHGSTADDSYSLLIKEAASPLLNIKEKDPELSGWSPYIQFIHQLKNTYAVSIIDLISCQLYNNPDMVYVVSTLEQHLRINFRASSNNTGELKSGGDWVQESDGVDIRSVYFTDAIEQYLGLLLIISTPPYISTQPASISVSTGSSATFSAVISNAKTPPTVYWYINGSAYSPTTLVNTGTFQYNTTYTFSYVSENASIYVAATTSSGTATSETVMLTAGNVVLPLQITSQTTGPISRQEGQTATFSVSAAGGTAPLTYQWLNMGVPISGATSSTYTTPTLKYNVYDGALYECIVTDANSTYVSSQSIILYVEKPVSIITQPQEQIITASSIQSPQLVIGSATYSITIDGSGSFTYVWYKGTEVVATQAEQATKTSTLQLNNIHLEDNGAQIKVVVSNSWSSVESDPISLIVGAPTTATDIISPTFSRVGGTATFSSTISGTDYNWYWMKNGAEIPGTFNTFSGTGDMTTTYTTPALTSEDNSAIYSIHISSSFGTATKQTTLTVGFAPVITSITNDVTFVSGNNVQITCTASGTGISYQWYKDGVALSGKTSQILSFTPFTASDVGVYKVSASNNFGTVFSSNCVVSIGAPPIIIPDSPYASYSTAYGKTLTFSVSASGLSPFSYQWKKNGIDILGATSNSYTTPILSLSDNNATYVVVVTNIYGSTTSGTFSIFIVSPPYIADQPISQIIQVGSTATLSVNVFSSTQVFFQWKKNGVNITNAISNVYTTPPMSLLNDGDLYSVDMQDGYGYKITSAPATITIARAPTITSQPVSQIGILGSTISTTIDASGTPSLKYSLVRSDNPSAPSTPTTNSTFVIDVSSVQHTYYVIVSNDYGSIQTNTWTVRAGVAPFIISQPQSRTLPIGYNTSFSVDVSGDGILTYQWKKDNIDISGATNASYDTTVSPSLTGTYTVVVSSIYGATTSTSALLMFTGSTINILSEPPVQQYITDGSSAILTYIVSSTSTLSYKWYKNNVEIPSSNSSSLSTNTLSVGANISSFTRYIYKVDISDDYSHITPDSVSVYVGYPPTASDISETTYVTIGSSKTLAVELYGSRQMTYIWRRNGVDISGTDGVITDANSSNIVVSYTIPSGISYSDNGAVYSLYAVNDYGTLTKQTTISVGYSPIITVQPISKSSGIDQFVSIVIDASGSTPLYYSLVYTDISSIPSTPSTNNTFSIKVENTLQMYYAVVSNNYGSVQTNTWGVGPTLTITSQPQNVAVPLNGTASFSVAATGSGTLTYQWFNGKGQILNGRTESTFTRSYVGAADSYYVVVSDYFGSVTSDTALLTIDYGTVPVFTTQPSDCVFAFGDFGGLACATTGAPPFSYQWYKNGVEISGATGQQLSFSPVTASDLGKYKVRVTNSYGSVVSREATVSTGVPPSFVDASSSTVYVLRGTTKTITVTDATNADGFQWMYENGDSVVGFTTSGPSLTIPVLTVYPESYAFKVVITNRFGSASKRINVYFGDPPTFRTQPITQAGFANTQATITLDVLGSPILNYSFYRSDNPTQPYVTTNPVFSDYYLNSVDRYVDVSNNYGTAQSNIWNFKIGNAPVITSQLQPKSMFVYDGSSILLSVSVIDEVGTPSYYQWKLNGIDITGATNPTYSVSSINANHAGAYTVSVSNRFGNSVSSTVWVNVLSTPIFTTQPNSIILNSSKPITILANTFINNSPIHTVSINAPSVSIDSEAFSGFTDVSSLTLTTTTLDTSILFIFSFNNLYTLNITNINSNILSGVSSFKGLLPKLRSLALTFTQGSDILYAPALTNSTSIETVVITGDRVVNMPPDAFSGCTNLKTLTITSKLYSLPYPFLSGCTSLKDIILNGNNIPCDSYFDELTSVETVKLTNFTHLPASNNSKWLFKWCEKLREVEIGPSLKSYISSTDFINAQTSLEKFIIHFDSDMTEYVAMDQWMINFNKLHTFEITGKAVIMGNIFSGSFSNILYGCTALKHIQIDGVCENPIARSSINHPLLETIDIRYGSRYTLNTFNLTLSIPKYAFKDLASLQSVIIRGKLASIDSGAFYGCTSLASIDLSQLSAFNPTIGLQIHSFAFGKTGLSGTIVIPETVSYMGEGCFVGCFNISKLIYNCPVLCFKDPINVLSDGFDRMPLDKMIDIKLKSQNKWITHGHDNIITSYKNAIGQMITLPSNSFRINVNNGVHKLRIKKYGDLIAELQNVYSVLRSNTSSSAVNAKNTLSIAIVNFKNDMYYAESSYYKMNPVNHLPSDYSAIASMAGISDFSAIYIYNHIILLDSLLYESSINNLRQSKFDELINEASQDYSVLNAAPASTLVSSGKYEAGRIISNTNLEKLGLLLQPYNVLNKRVPSYYQELIQNAVGRQTRATIISNEIDTLKLFLNEIFTIPGANDTTITYFNSHKLPEEDISITVNTKNINIGLDATIIRKVNENVLAIMKDEQLEFQLVDGTIIDMSGEIEINMSDLYDPTYANIIYEIFSNPIFRIAHDDPDYEFNGKLTDVQTFSEMKNNSVTINSDVIIIQYAACTNAENVIFTLNGMHIKLHERAFAEGSYSTVKITTPNEIIAGSCIFENSNFLTIDTNKELINIPTEPIFVDAGGISFNNIHEVITDYSPVKTIGDIIDVEFNVLIPEMNEILTPTMYGISFTQWSTLKQYDIIIQPEDWFWCYKLDSVQEQKIGDNFSNNGHKYKYVPTSATPAYSAPGVYAGLNPEEYCGLEHTFAPDTFTYKGRTYTRKADSKHNGDVSVNAYFSTLQKAKDDIKTSFNETFFWIGALLTMVAEMILVAVITVFLPPAAPAAITFLAHAVAMGITIGVSEVVKEVGPIRISTFTEPDSSRSVSSAIRSGWSRLKNGVIHAFSRLTTRQIPAAGRNATIANARQAGNPAFGIQQFNRVNRANILPKKRQLLSGRVSVAPIIEGDTGIVIIETANPINNVVRSTVTTRVAVMRAPQRLTPDSISMKASNVIKARSSVEANKVIQQTVTAASTPRTSAQTLNPLLTPVASRANSITVGAVQAVRLEDDVVDAMKPAISAATRRARPSFVRDMHTPPTNQGNIERYSFYGDNPLNKFLKRKGFIGADTKSISFLTKYYDIIVKYNAICNDISVLPNSINKVLPEFMSDVITALKTSSYFDKQDINYIELLKMYMNRGQEVFLSIVSLLDMYKTEYNIYNTIDSFTNIMHRFYLESLPTYITTGMDKSNAIISTTYQDIKMGMNNINIPPYLFVSDKYGTNYNTSSRAYGIHYYIGCLANGQNSLSARSIEGFGVMAMTKANPLMRMQPYCWAGTYPGEVKNAGNPQRYRDGDNPILCVNNVGGGTLEVGGDQLYLGNRKALYDLTSVDTPNYVYSGATNLIVKLRDITSIAPYSFTSASTDGSIGSVLPYTILNLQLPPTLKSIGNRAFYMADIDTCIIPDSCTTIGTEAFANGKIKTVKIVNYVAPIEPKSIKTTLGPNTILRVEGQNFILENVPSVMYVDSSNNEHTHSNVQYLVVAVNSLVEYINVNTIDIQSSQVIFTGDDGARVYYANDISQIDVPFTDSTTLSVSGRILTHTGLTQITSRYPTTFGSYYFPPSKFIDEIPEYQNNSYITNFYTTAIMYDGVYYYPRVYTLKKNPNHTWVSTTIELKENSSLRFVAPHFALISTPRGLSRDLSRELLDISGITIGDSAFAGNTYLVNVSIPASVEVIGANAFANCTSLTTIDLPASLTTIGDNAFAGATSLTSITIPPTVETIGAGAFSGATSLTEVVIPSNATIASDAFAGATSLTSIVFPEGLSSTVNATFLQSLSSSVTIIVPPEQTAQFSVILTSVNPNITLQTTTGEVVEIPCFPMGTRILTTNGFKEVEKLDSKVDKIITADGRVVSYKRYYSLIPKTTQQTAPYSIPPHTFGQNMPTAPVCLSPLHAIQLKKGLWNIPLNLVKEHSEIKQYDIGRAVLYFHIELPDYFRDNIVVEGGLVVESFGGARIANKDSIYTYNRELGGFTRSSGERSMILNK